MKRPNFALLGASGYVAPRHIKAIKAIEGSLTIAHDPSDSVGILDGAFPNVQFFPLFEQFDEAVQMIKDAGNRINYFSICSPNFLHRPHIGYALRAGSHAICEKPLVLSPTDFDILSTLEKTEQKRVYSILQLRLHPSIQSLKKKVATADPHKKFDVDLSYITSRGPWYHTSWKGNDDKSGGIACNIGVHFFDMLQYIFGSINENTVHYRAADAVAGYLECKRARVRWLLSINRDHLPERTPLGQATFRSIILDGEEIEFSQGFNDLHIESYRQILSGEGFGLAETRPSIEIVHAIRHASIEPTRLPQHPSLKDILK